MPLRTVKAIVIDDPYFEPIAVITKANIPYHSPYSVRVGDTGQVIQAKTLESLYRKLAYRAKKGTTLKA